MPILSIGGFRKLLGKSKAKKVAVSPMLGDGAFSGPAAGLLSAQGLKPTSEGVARLYKGVVDVLIIDESDRAQAQAIEKTGVSCVLTSTLMKTREDETRLAKVAMEA
jgi:LPPG:FO 2-phospho-L-lactate transferase